MLVKLTCSPGSAHNRNDFVFAEGSGGCRGAGQHGDADWWSSDAFGQVDKCLCDDLHLRAPRCRPRAFPANWSSVAIFHCT